MPEATRPKGVYLTRMDVVGLHYHSWDEVQAQIARDDILELIREPDNAHDPLAIRVMWRGKQLGYIPRSQNAMLARLMDQGLRFVALYIDWPVTHYRFTMALYYLPPQEQQP